MLRLSGIEQIDQWLWTMTPQEAGHLFEERLRTLFEDLGCHVENVGKCGGDFGTDLIARWGAGGSDESMAIQAKLYDWRSRRYVGNDAVLQAYGGAHPRGISKSLRDH